VDEAKPTRFEECILCGSATAPKSKEDVLPNWIRDFAVSEGDGRPFVGSRRGQPYSGKRPPAIVTRAVCIECNGWMNKTFEIPAKPILIPLFRGQPHVLSPAEQQTLACWITKSVLMRAASDFTPHDLMPMSEYQRFRKSGIPATEARVLIGALAQPGEPIPLGPSLGTFPARLTTQTARPAGKWVAYRNELVIGRLVIQYVQVLDGNVYRSVAEVRRLLVKIWPGPGGPVTWPPPQLITHENARMVSTIT
jgi:hypothetical protein